MNRSKQTTRNQQVGDHEVRRQEGDHRCLSATSHLKTCPASCGVSHFPSYHKSPSGIISNLCLTVPSQLTLDFRVGLDLVRQSLRFVRSPVSTLRQARR